MEGQGGWVGGGGWGGVGDGVPHTLIMEAKEGSLIILSYDSAQSI